MATQMTRAEYQAMYGSSPVLSSSKIDTRPAPIRMTQAEYDAQYRPKRQTFRQDASADIADTKTGQQDALTRGVDRSAQVDQRVASGETGKTKGALQKFGSGLFTAADIVGQTLFGAVKTALPQAAETQIADTLGKDLAQIAAPETRQSFINKLKESDGGLLMSGDLDNTAGKFLEDVGVAYKNDANFRADVIAAGGILSFLALPGTARTALTKTADVASNVASSAKIDVAPLVRKITTPTADKIETRRVSDLSKLEDRYSQFRRLNEFQADGGIESRGRIARSNVLEGVADEDGVIRTKGKGGAVEQYRKATIDGVEDVVKRNLDREGKSVTLPQIKAALVKEIATKSGLEGADLTTALKGVERELSGLGIRMDELGQVSLSKLQDAKINTTKNINFNTPPETATYRKAVARTYKNIIEKNSDFNVKEVNAELAKFYKDIERLEMLDGKRVKGGRLGKYFAQVSGNIVGGAAGSAVGGPFGAAVGTIAGGEAASFISGKTMSRAFGKGGVLPEKNPVLAAAREQAGLPPGRSLETPDPVVGIPANIKAKIAESGTPEQKAEVSLLERQMRDNIEKQKVAIKAKDFTLVSSLKEVYDSLVTSLKELVAEIVESVKNPTIGLSIKSTVTPELVAKKMDFEDLQNVTTFLEDPQASLLNDKLNRMVDEIGIGKADLDTQTKFLIEVTDEADRMGLLQSNNLGKRNTQYSPTATINKNVIDDTVAPETVDVKGSGMDKSATTQTTLLEEAKKYKTADEFIKAQGEPVFHGTNQDFDDIDLSKSTRNMFGRGFSVTTNPEFTKYYGSKTKDFVLSPEAKVYKSNTAEIKQNDFATASKLYEDKFGKKLQMTKYRNELHYKKDTPFSRVFWVSENPEVLKAKELWGDMIKSKGFDVVKEGDTINVLNPNVLKTKAQLTDIWKQANQ